ncbi:MAG: ParB/RepB/Spo0J family partition protein [Candidatus Eisenbacteria bacterium]|nr:ParB/RepB/Spo0J family partition protein [Candidatus Eisenbacteria bacterium]
MNRKALGRGLGALIPGAEAPTAGPGLAELRVGDIEPNPEQPRTMFDEESLGELAASIKAYGLLQPVIVREFGGGKYRLVAGERRWRAARLAGLETVSAVIRNSDDAGAIAVALVENLQRENLNPIDEAHGYETLMEVAGATQVDVAERVGKDRSTVANALRLLDLPPDVQQMLRSGKLSAGHGRALLGLGSPDERRRVAERAAARGLSVREVEALARGAVKRKKAARPRRSDDPFIREWEERLQRVFGTLVRIERLGKEGSVRIEYYSDEDLERILEQLTMGGAR